MLFTSLLSIIAPHECLGCGEEGVLLCARCADSLKPAAECCYRCKVASARSMTCSGCRQHSSVKAVYAAAQYEGLAKDLLWKLKFGRAGDAANEAGRLIGRCLSNWPKGPVIVTYVPTASSRIRQRGYDQAERIARSVAAELSLPCYGLLRRQHDRKQVGASRSVRKTQLNDAFRPVNTKNIQNATILLIDDVVTTGATLEAAAAVLRTAGARRIEAAVFARA